MIGHIVQVSGSVIDVRFEEGQLPKINEALTVELNGKTLVMEVAQHIGNGLVATNELLLLVLNLVDLDNYTILSGEVGRHSHTEAHSTLARCHLHRWLYIL